jgi:hypothetical protein
MKKFLWMGLLPLALVSCQKEEAGNCADGEDNDGNGVIDCADVACAEDPVCVEGGNCDDDTDNDLNGQQDCFDDACADDAACVSDGFSSPESVFFDSATNAFYVSNQGGAAAGDGFISKIDADTRAVTLNFTTGLNSPAGLRVNNGSLFVADGNTVVSINLADGTIQDTIDASAVVFGFLNDLAIDPANGDVYASDSPLNTIIRIPGGNGTPEVFLTDVGLETPNGLLIDGGNLLVAGLGVNFSFQTFTADEPGRILSVDLANQAITAVSDNRLGGLDGLERDGANLLTSDFFGPIFSIDAKGVETEVVNVAGRAGSAADIGFDPVNRVIAAPELLKADFSAGTEVNFFDLDDLVQ